MDRGDEVVVPPYEMFEFTPKLLIGFLEGGDLLLEDAKGTAQGHAGIPRDVGVAYGEAGAKHISSSRVRQARQTAWSSIQTMPPAA